LVLSETAIEAIEAPWGSKSLTTAEKWRALRLNHRRFTHQVE
jgi:hypothetical protein